MTQPVEIEVIHGDDFKLWLEAFYAWENILYWFTGIRDETPLTINIG